MPPDLMKREAVPFGEPRRARLSAWPREHMDFAKLEGYLVALVALVAWPVHGWGRGFITALALGSQAAKWRGISAGAAVRAIANITASSAPFRPNAVDDLVCAVLSLMGQRALRGPLGPLAAVVMQDSAARAADA
ncbi:MAG: hypothetical protein ABI821_06175 [Pseudomonadota bacterium]